MSYIATYTRITSDFLYFHGLYTSKLVTVRLWSDF